MRTTSSKSNPASGRPDPFRRVAGSPHRLPGFTLLELLLVLAIIVAVVSLVAPALKTPLENYRLGAAADRVCSLFAGARVKAIRDGRVYAFSYRPDGGACRTGPWSRATGGESDSGGPAASAAAASGDIADSQTGERQEELPEGIRFVLPETVAGAGGEPAEYHAGDSTPAGGEWSPPILFFPDGTTTTARVVLSNGKRAVAVELRGLTGTTRLGELQSIEEIAQ